MLTIRPIAISDRAGFVALHGRSDDSTADALIAASQRAFAASGVSSERQLFVLEDPDFASGGGGAGTLLGVGALAGAIGLELPRFCYRTGVVVHASPELKLFHRAATLLLCNDHTGHAELVPPIMASGDPSQAPARLLIEAMLLYAIDHADRFATSMVAELAGVRFEGGGSPFWNSLGSRFYAGRLAEDDAFVPSSERSHIGRLMPKHPLYSSFLDADARACIGKRSGSARNAAEALHAQGFRHRGHVDVFDAGPLLVAEVADLAVCRQSRIAIVELGEAGSPAEGEAKAGTGGAAERAATGEVDTATCLVASEAGNGKGTGFRAALVRGTVNGGTLVVHGSAARRAGLAAGQRVRVLPQSGGDATLR